MYRYGNASNQTTFRSSTPLDNYQIARYAPSVMASEAHQSRGEKYAFIPTIDVVEGMRKEGFLPYEVRQTKVRDLGKREHTKHMVRFRQANQIGAAVGEEVPEIILLNSHDGTSSYQLMAGFFRMVCSNGLIAGTMQNDIRVRHSGNVVHDVIEGATRVLEDIELASNHIGEFKGIALDAGEQRAFANAALALRYDEGKAPVVAEAILRPRRWEDNKGDLWTTFNRVQESMIQGGVRGRNANGRATTTRAVGGVNENVRLNRALWTLAQGLADIKQGQRDEAFAAQYEHAFGEH